MSSMLQQSHHLHRYTQIASQDGESRCGCSQLSINFPLNLRTSSACSHNPMLLNSLRKKSLLRQTTLIWLDQNLEGIAMWTQLSLAHLVGNHRNYHTCSIDHRLVLSKTQVARFHRRWLLPQLIRQERMGKWGFNHSIQQSSLVVLSWLCSKSRL